MDGGRGEGPPLFTTSPASSLILDSVSEDHSGKRTNPEEAGERRTCRASKKVSGRQGQKERGRWGTGGPQGWDAILREATTAGTRDVCVTPGWTDAGRRERGACEPWASVNNRESAPAGSPAGAMGPGSQRSTTKGVGELWSCRSDFP